MMYPCLAIALLCFAASAEAQDGAQAQDSAQGQNTSLAARSGAEKEWTAERLEQLVAPIALYSDGVLAQVLMASTYPLEIVEAARWVAKNSKLEGAKLEEAMKAHDWDPSVKSICGLREVLARMNENLDWTQDLGDAFLAEKAKLMDAVQHMRRKAMDAGELKTSEEQKVTDQEDKIIVIEQTSQEVVYVPTYYPSAVYGSWSYPYWYYPPMYVPPPAGSRWFAFGVGVAWGAAIWGGCHWGWGHTDIDIDCDHHNEFTKNVDRDAAKNRIESRQGQRDTWQHNAEHRKGVGYQDAKVAERFGAAAGQHRVTRDQARGFADRAGTRPTTRDATRPQPSQRDTARATPSTRDRNATSAARPSTRTSGQRTGSFTGARTNDITRASSTRGATSRASSVRSTGGSRSAGASRSSGAVRSGGRSGGGMRGGGRR